MRITSFLAGFMSGAVVGGVAALLLAPESGAELRQETRAGVDHLWDDARQAAEAKRAELQAQLKSLTAPREPAAE